jgi:acyl-CoA reductase-like NAD-dependent aldehyde dehydrogenase
MRRVPFGGQKDSGTRTEYSIEELYSCTQNKTVSVNLQ